MHAVGWGSLRVAGCVRWKERGVLCRTRLMCCCMPVVQVSEDLHSGLMRGPVDSINLISMTLGLKHFYAGLQEPLTSPA